MKKPVVLCAGGGYHGAKISEKIAAMVGDSFEVRNFAIDLRDDDAVHAAFADADVSAVVHLGATEDDDQSGQPDGERIDAITRGSWNLLKHALNAGVRRFVLASSLSFFLRFPASYRVDESWRPRPTTDLDNLLPYLLECSFREGIRTQQDARAVCVRLGRDDSSSTHANAALLAATLRQLMDDESSTFRNGWNIRHDARRPVAPDRGFGDDWRACLQHENLIGRMNLDRFQKRHIVIFGAGGPVGAVLAEMLADAGRGDFLRLCDVRPLDEIACDNNPQSVGAPVAKPLPSPHENRVVDVTDASAVSDACAGMDTIVNLTVVRNDAEGAFRVNVVGAYNICRAAMEHRIPRVVQTGPQQILFGHTGYWGNYDIPGDAPARPGLHLYAHSKFLGQEICRVFAETHEIEIPNLLFCAFVNPETATDLYHFSISWRDSAWALRQAIETKTMLDWYEEINIVADLPHNQVGLRRARTILYDWEPFDNFSRLWMTNESETNDDNEDITQP